MKKQRKLESCTCFECVHGTAITVTFLPIITVTATFLPIITISTPVYCMQYRRFLFYSCHRFYAPTVSWLTLRLRQGERREEWREILLSSKHNTKFSDFQDENRLIFVVLSGRFQNLILKEREILAFSCDRNNRGRCRDETENDGNRGNRGEDR